MSAIAWRLIKLVGVVFVCLGVVAAVATFRPALAGQPASANQGLRGFAQVIGGSSIGAELRDLDAADVSREKLAGTAGALVDSVEADSPAARAGLKAGDVVTAFDAEKIRSARQLTRLIEETPAGRTVTMTVVRAGASVDLKVTPEAGGLASMDPFGGQFFTLPDFRSFSNGPRGGNRAAPSIVPADPAPPRLGVTVTELTDQLGDYFGTRVGVLVTSVADATPAKTAGLKAGDVITRVNGQVVRSEEDLRRRLAVSAGDVAITLMRDHKEQIVTAHIEADKIEPETPKRIIK